MSTLAGQLDGEKQAAWVFIIMCGVGSESGPHRLRTDTLEPLGSLMPAEDPPPPPADAAEERNPSPRAKERASRAMFVMRKATCST